MDEALRLLRVAANSFTPFAMVLSDLQMPEKDGVDLIRAMKAEEAIADIPVILLSSGELPHGTPPTLYSANLVKPVRPSDLLRAMAAAAGAWESFDLEHLQDRAREDALLVSNVRLRVLLVEDIEVNQMVASHMLRELGHDTEVAGNGQEALDMLAKQDFDIVFMDIQMPVMDGLQALAAIRNREAWERRDRHTPVVAMTANSLKGDRERYLKAGMDAYISKPIIMEDLAGVIDDLTRRFELASREDVITEENDEAAETRSSLGGSMPPPIEPDVLERSFAGDTELARESMEIYLRDAPVMLEKIQASIGKHDNASLAAGAHALKGLSGYYTQGDVYLACLELEHMGHDKALPDNEEKATRAFAVLQEQADELMLAMKTYIAGKARQSDG